MSCWWCGGPLSGGDRFCPGCGESRRADGPWEHGVDRGLWPAEGENRVLTVLFPDLCGYMAASKQAPGDEAVQLVNTVQSTYIAAIVANGGFVARCQHDEVLALFGVPTAHVDDPLRAVRAALQIRIAIRALGLDVKIGINTGLVYFGPVGSDLHSELAVVGPAADAAARLVGKGAQLALPGQILVGESTAEQTRHAIEYGLPRVHELKGIRTPVSSYEVTGVRAEIGEPELDVNDDARWSRLAAKLDHLPRTQRQVLQVASLIGAPFEAARLGGIAVDAAVLEDLVTGGWLDRDSRRYVVRDAAVMNVLSRSLVPARRTAILAALTPASDD